MDWEINKSALECSACKAVFEGGQGLHSALYDEVEGFIRRDYCDACWESADKSAVFSFWRTRVPKKGEKVRQFVDDDTLMNFLTRLAGEADRAKRNFRYVLALLLMRKKLLKFRESVMGDGGEELVLVEPKTAVEHHVFNPQLTDEELAQVRDEIGQVLNVKL